jgi:hypothetical protein
MEARLNHSFDFLVPKEDRVPEWILADDEAFFAFLAGYLDAEGYVKIALPRGYRTPQVRIEIRSYDAHLLQQLAHGLNARGLLCPDARIRVPAGYVNRYGLRSNRALWGFGISRKDTLRQVFNRVEPHLRHERRRHDMARARSVVFELPAGTYQPASCAT